MIKHFWRGWLISVLSAIMCDYKKMIYLCLVTVGLLSVSVSGRGELYERIGKC